MARFGVSGVAAVTVMPFAGVTGLDVYECNDLLSFRINTFDQPGRWVTSQGKLSLGSGSTWSARPGEPLRETNPSGGTYA